VVVERSYQSIPPAYVNGNQIQQVLLNLLINARQAMPNGGRLWIKLLWDAENNMVDLVVRDNGCGIPAEKLPRIFESFYTTKNGPDASGKGGTGLGLSMCRDILEAHHGRIRVDSTVGKGTAFTLKLPAAAKPAPKNPPLTPPITMPISAVGQATAGNG
jgi:signal transduction histidine kinase